MMDEELERLLGLFSGREVVPGAEIIEWMGLPAMHGAEGHILWPEAKETTDFFSRYCGERVLETNPGHQMASAIYGQNSYGLWPEWRRLQILRELGI